jgi:putative endonuclease
MPVIMVSKPPLATHTRAKGSSAEQVAADYLLAKGYQILERNFSCRVGELDIIARHEGDVVFVEVRSASSRNTVDPVYSVNYRKQSKISRAAEWYLSTHFAEVPAARFDVVVVRMSAAPQVEIFRDAFSVPYR